MPLDFESSYSEYADFHRQVLLEPCKRADPLNDFLILGGYANHQNFVQKVVNPIMRVIETYGLDKPMQDFLLAVLEEDGIPAQAIDCLQGLDSRHPEDNLLNTALAFGYLRNKLDGEGDLSERSSPNEVDELEYNNCLSELSEEHARFLTHWARNTCRKNRLSLSVTTA